MFCQKLNITRKTQGKTAQQMADMLGIGIRTYRNYESGNRQPSLEMLVEIAKILNVTTDYLLIESCEVPSGERQI